MEARLALWGNRKECSLPKPHGGGAKPKLNTQQLAVAVVAQLMEQANDVTLEELVTQQSVKNRSLGQPGHVCVACVQRIGAGDTSSQANPKKKPCMRLSGIRKGDSSYEYSIGTKLEQ